MISPARRCREAIRRVGCRATLERDGERLPLLASVQPQWGEEAPGAGPLGMGGHARAVLYAPADGPAPLPGDRVVLRDRSYRVERAELRHLAGQPLYHRALLREESGEGGIP